MERRQLQRPGVGALASQREPGVTRWHAVERLPEGPSPRALCGFPVREGPQLRWEMTAMAMRCPRCAARLQDPLLLLL